MTYNITGVSVGGSRFYLSYSGSAPSPGDCQSLAASIRSEWGNSLNQLVNPDSALTSVDVIDIASNKGNSGQDNTTVVGIRTGPPMPAQTCTNVEFGIANRYRGGKPRMYLPPPADTDQLDQAHWTPAFITLSNDQCTAFFQALAQLSIGSLGTLRHVNLSYYHGFENVTNSSGRTHAAPTYRPTALHDPVNNYITKAVIGSQKRRRTSTTP
jgi:hypothetical protein